MATTVRQVRLDPDLDAALSRFCDANERSASWVIRKALGEFLGSTDWPQVARDIRDGNIDVPTAMGGSPPPTHADGVTHRTSAIPRKREASPVPKGTKR